MGMLRDDALQITNKVSRLDHTHWILKPKLEGISNTGIHVRLMEALQLQVFKCKELQTN